MEFRNKDINTRKQQNQHLQSSSSSKSSQYITETKKHTNTSHLLHNGIISLHYSQSSQLFAGRGQGLQCVANSIMSLIYNMYKLCNLWGINDLKNILYSGNILYNSIGKFTTLLVSDLPKYIKLYKNIYHIQEVNSVIGNIFDSDDNFNFVCFKHTEHIITKYKYCILVIGDSAISLMHVNNCFYTFDPHSRNTCGFPDNNGGSIALKFKCFEQLCLYINQLSMYLCSTNYEMTPVIILKQNEMISNTKTQKQERNITNTATLQIPTNKLVTKNNSQYPTTQNNTVQFENPINYENNFCENNLVRNSNTSDVTISNNSINKTIFDDKNIPHHNPKKTNITECKDTINNQIPDTNNIHHDIDDKKRNITQCNNTINNQIPDTKNIHHDIDDKKRNIIQCNKTVNNQIPDTKNIHNNIDDKITEQFNSTINYSKHPSCHKSTIPINITKNVIENTLPAKQADTNPIEYKDQLTNTIFTNNTVNNYSTPRSQTNVKLKRKLEKSSLNLNKQTHQNKKFKTTSKPKMKTKMTKQVTSTNEKQLKYTNMKEEKESVIQIKNNIITLEHEQQNILAYVNALKSHKLSQSYGYNFKLTLVKLDDIQLTLNMLNQQINLQLNKQKIIITKQHDENKSKNSKQLTQNVDKRQQQQSEIEIRNNIISLEHEQQNIFAYVNALKSDKLCKNYGYNLKLCSVELDDIQLKMNMLNLQKSQNSTKLTITLDNKSNYETNIKTQKSHNPSIIKKKPKSIIQQKTKSTYEHNLTTLQHNQQNIVATVNALKTNRISKKYGYNLKLCFVQLTDIQITSSSSIHISNYDKQKYGKNLNDSIKIFNNFASEGPIYVCSLCLQTQFKDNISLIEKMRNKKNFNLLTKCRTNYKSIDQNEYICNTCKEYIYKGQIPKISVMNGCSFPAKPHVLDLFNLEERFISPVMAFMLIHQLLPGGQLSLSGSICHLPIEIGKVINTLPRTFNQYETISVKLKRRLCYKNSVFCENVRPHKIIQALKYLLETSELYQQHNININHNWMEYFSENNHQQEINNNIQKDIQNPNDNKDNSSDEDFSDEDLPNAPSVNTLLAQKTFDTNKDILCIAPAEGQKPIFTDPDTEYLCFPTIFCGKRRPENKYHKLSKREIFKNEMKSIDRRVATNVPNIFWKTKYKQINQIHQQVSFALRRNQTKGEKITAKILLNKDTREKIVKYDDGYRIFKNVRSSPPYFEHKRKDLMAMIRQLGIPTLFISLSAADTKWTELLQTIYTLIYKKTITNEEAENMTWNQKCNLISKDPGTCARYFNNRIKKFIKHILKSPHSPFGKLLNFFYRVEFQHRGSPHIHGLLWIKDAPHYENNSENEIIQYVNSIISCEKNAKHQKFIDMQIHKHSKTCIKKIHHNKKCRFGAPWPPLDNTQILHPLDEHHLVNKTLYSDSYKKINKCIQMKYKNKDFIPFNELLQELDMSYEHYLLALRSTINKKKIFLKRSLQEIFINNYMKDLVHVWKANHDIQYVLDPYSCVVYICDYLMKNNQGMSRILQAAAKEAREGNMDLKQSVRHIGNRFLNCNEMSEQECAYSLLELPITQSSVKVEFINTSEINNRVFIAKPDHILQTMNPESEEIKQKNSIDRYADRPYCLKYMCLADFVATTETIYTSKQILSDDELSINEDTSDEENSKIYENSNILQDIQKLFPIKLKNKTIKLRKKHKVLRFVNYKYKTDPENYCREKLLLYIPWAKNELQILEKHKTYIDAYNCYQTQIKQKMKIYEPAAQIIEHAILVYEEHPDKFKPVSSSIIEDNNNIELDTNIIDEQYSYLIPDDNNQSGKYDLRDDLKIQTYNYVENIKTKANILDNSAFMKLINSLNPKQYEFFLYIMQQQLHNQNKHTLACLHGGAGTGKSHVLKALYQALFKVMNNKPGQSTDALTVLLVAPTGKAAHNIKGHTIHAAFHIPANQSLANYTKLSWDTLNSYRSKYLHLKWIICDEISMVSNYMLKFIHLRLQEIKSNNLLFGGVNIITVGDLYQLKPVMGQFIFEDYRSDYGPLATNLWTQNFKIFELTEIMRQKDDKQFAKLLNRLRIGTHTQNDIRLLKKTKTQNKHLADKHSIPHFFPTREQVNLYNEKISNNPTSFMITSTCTDILPASISQILETNIHIAISKRKISHTGGLPQEVILIANEQYDLISNIDVEDGLINGAQCSIKFIQTGQKDNITFPYIVWVEFEDKEIGKKFRSKYSYLYTEQKNRDFTPIIKIKRSFIVKDHWIHRLQFPLRQAAARSIHVSQSSTYPEIYVDLETISNPPKIFWEHMHYVAFSRVTSLSGLYIHNINEKCISVSNKVKEYIQKASETNKLETDIEFKGKYTLNIVFNNSRSFKKYFNDIQANTLLQKQDINIFSESRLCKHDKSTNYTIDKFITIRADQKNSTIPHYGIISYISDTIQINNVEYMSTLTIDTLYTNITFRKKKISIFSIYSSPQNTFPQIKKHIMSLLPQEYNHSTNIILIGDLNIEYKSPNYFNLCSELSKYNLQQHVNKYTTIHNTTIDYIFTNLTVKVTNTFYAHWSDHYMIQSQIKI